MTGYSHSHAKTRLFRPSVILQAQKPGAAFILVKAAALGNVAGRGFTTTFEFFHRCHAKRLRKLFFFHN